MVQNNLQGQGLTQKRPPLPERQMKVRVEVRGGAGAAGPKLGCVGGEARKTEAIKMNKKNEDDAKVITGSLLWILRGQLREESCWRWREGLPSRTSTPEQEHDLAPQHQNSLQRIKVQNTCTNATKFLEENN